jgi:DNA-binding LacI/PurR family transcriptional regulator
LVGQKSSTLGVVITTLLNPFYAEITPAIIVRAKEEGYDVLASSVGNGGPEVEQHYVVKKLYRSRLSHSEDMRLSWMFKNSS